MEFKKNIILLSLLTGALASTSFNVGQSNKNYVSLLYDVSPLSVYESVDIIDDTDISIPIFDSMVPQGLTYVNGLFLMSSYDYDNENNSHITVLNYGGDILNVCDLGNKAHVGGISYDDENKWLWVTGINGAINIYDVNDILTCTSALPIYPDLMVGDDLVNFKNPFYNSVSFLTVCNSKLYVGNFSLNDQGILKEYKITFNDSVGLKLEFVKKISIPNKVQGVTFYKKDDTSYIIFNRSYGQNVPSILQMFKYNPDISDYRDSDLLSVCLEYPPMMEQSIILENKIYSIFESAAKPYYFDKFDTESMTEVNLDILIKRLQK